MMNKQATAKLKNLRIAPRKVRLVADVVRGMHVNAAIAQLQVTSLRSSEPLEKLIKSAIANAKEQSMNTENLVVKTIFVDKGMMLKRFRPRARGSASEIQKKFSHVTLILEESPDVKTPEYMIREKAKKVKPAKGKGEKSKTKDSKVKTPDKDLDEAQTKKAAPQKPGFFKKTFKRKTI